MTDNFGISFTRYALVMVPINFVAIIVSLSVLWFYFDRYIPTTYSLSKLKPPSCLILDPLIFRSSPVVIIGLSMTGFTTIYRLGLEQ
jgi:arsenical pump membrane protein